MSGERFQYSRGVPVKEIERYCHKFQVRMPTTLDDLEMLLEDMGNMPGFGVIDDEEELEQGARLAHDNLDMGEGAFVGVVPTNELDKPPISLMFAEIDVSPVDAVVGTVGILKVIRGQAGYDQMGYVRKTRQGEAYVFWDSRTGRVGRRPVRQYEGLQTKKGRSLVGSVDLVLPRHLVEGMTDKSITQPSFDRWQGKGGRVVGRELLLVIVDQRE